MALAPVARGSAILRRESVPQALILAFVLAVDVPGLGRFLSVDEAAQLPVCLRSIPHIATHFHNANNHPFYAILAHGAIRLLPLPTDQAARVPALLAGILIPVVFYRTQRRWVGREAAILVALLLVVVDPLRQYAPAARGYSLLILGVLILNHLVLAYLRSGRTRLAVAYVLVAAATSFTHLWAFPVLSAHGAFLIVEAIRARREPVEARRVMAMLAALAVAIAVGVLLYLPMARDILAMAGTRRADPWRFPLVESALQLARFGSWTVAAYLLLIPILLEGGARGPAPGASNRPVLLHATVLLCVLAEAALLHPVNFGSRFLLGIVPSAAALAAWCLSGVWQSEDRAPSPTLPRPATWLIGFAVGVIVANAPFCWDPHANNLFDLPGHDSWLFLPRSWQAPAVAVDRLGDGEGYALRRLAQAVGDPRAGLLLLAGVAGIGLRGRLPRLPAGLAGRMTSAAIVCWTGLLLASLLPLVLGRHYFQPEWLNEVSMVAAAAVLLLAWEHRFDGRRLRSLRPGLLMCALVAVAGQTGTEPPTLTMPVILALAASLPPVFIVAAVAQATVPGPPGTEPVSRYETNRGRTGPPPALVPDPDGIE